MSQKRQDLRCKVVVSACEAIEITARGGDVAVTQPLHDFQKSGPCFEHG